ncbi:oxygen-independent coproporphyrinogen III oxidase [Hansschlegelia plantiphila]|uniref:Coproporphyrinogen-III oxidase n=1 Tax=Hansschlegelia plantiphila TaxID=374655 RepID=A0A9W6J3A1_9HYPH|nr:oxygen-independent coproporphyrinogen III oxidase [Hansschlegelia plantiphila]GLK68519.1 oxygen-independent coproporphyrinogen III oxidase [Hansschlegelia plantiphila]
MIPLTLTDFVSRQVPRYTSYPTAPHFRDDVDGGVYASWLEGQASSPAPVSLYLHVPFCRSICHYCGCTTRATRRDEPLLDYAVRLRKELALVSDRIGRRQISHIHWGGGTPSLLLGDAFADIVADIRRRWDVAPAAEHAIELDPRFVDSSAVARLSAAGVNRASLGVQDFDQAVQTAIGRLQSIRTVASAVSLLRRGGVSNLNFDLIYGLPRQTQASIRNTVREAVDLAPDRIALFGYAHVPDARPNQRLIDPSTLPDAALRLALAQTAREVLDEAGYVAVGIDHFARPGDAMAGAASSRSLRRNFQGYTTDGAETLIGVGASSISRLPQGYAQNASDVGGWARAIDEGRLPTARGRALGADDRLRADVIEQIMCFFEVDLDAVARRHGVKASVFALDLEALEPLRRSDFLRYYGDRLVIVRDGPALARVVASAFDSYLGVGTRHSMAA